jgi:hypothetical protein
MADFEIKIPGALPYCGDTGKVIQPGEILRVELDVVKFPGVIKPEIDLLVNSYVAGQVWDPDTSQLVSGYIYQVTPEAGDLPADLTDIDYCDIVSHKCKGCCDVVLDQLNIEAVNWVSSSISLHTILEPNNGALYQSKGYYNPTDGGGNLFQYEEASTATCDGGFVFDGKGGDNSLANTATTYPGTGVGRYVAIDKISIRSQQFGANLGAVGDSFRRAATLASGAGFGELTYNPPLLGDGEGVNVVVPTLGAAITDHVFVAFSKTLQGVFMVGFVETANNVTVRFQNETGGAVDIAEGLIETRAFKL